MTDLPTATPCPTQRRALGLMVVHTPKGPLLEHDLGLAARLGASLVELLPQWHSLPEPGPVRETIAQSGLTLWSVHGPWGGQAIAAARVDLADLNSRLRQDSIDDVLRALDWSARLGAGLMVVHPGGLSAHEDLAERTERLTQSLDSLSLEAESRNIRIGLENMPRGVFPGSRMADLAEVVRQINRPAALGLVLDTGHARISGDIREETLAAQGLLISTHVHDNDGRSDSHRPPGEGVLDWPAWFAALDEIGYSGPILLECVKALREGPEDRIDNWICRYQIYLEIQNA